MKLSIRKKLLKSFFVGQFIFTLVLPTTTSAHELIPPALKEYVQTHPNATNEEILKFANEQAPQFTQKFRDGVAIVNLIQNQKSSFLDNIKDFIVLGFNHILSGYDHILFILSLLLIFISWKEILKLTGTFTVAHSITLILAVTGAITLSPRIVEPLIALSIAYVAFTTVFLRGKLFVGEERGKIASVFFFGLFHGLGFAGLLKEIKIPDDKFISSLVSFNIGIEFGQIFIVLLVFPFIYFFRHKLWYPKTIKVFASIIIAVALYWFIQRVFFKV